MHTLTIEKGVLVVSLKPFFCLFFSLTLIDIDVNVTEIGVDGKSYETCLKPTDNEGYLFW